MARTSLAPLVLLLSIACGSADGATGSSDERAASTASAGDEGTEAREDDAPAAAAGDPRMDAMLAAHDARREAHCAAPLSWSDALASTAQAWADHLAASGCHLEHSRGPYGENLAAATAGTLSPEDVTELWYREREGYDFRGGGFSMTTGHFTQLVWVGSSQMGCGIAQCGGLDVWVCNYDPPGNVETQYRENVLPTSCR